MEYRLRLPRAVDKFHKIVDATNDPFGKLIDKTTKVRYNNLNDICFREPADCRGRRFPYVFSGKISQN